MAGEARAGRLSEAVVSSVELRPVGEKMPSTADAEIPGEIE